ncbi:tetratricopeptide repeat protein [Terriglobus roseus]|uniref:Tetratricopeptide repeat-containing protein n=1 Tax=Terriglobus roseus TaxID=392734 RepID=A0A1G7GN07_9BACT|nr:tetratricopeptide repeat protein [Terriglobus roseus]SDE89486.1 Tetratricopeptide repeat-containing protein [Terriglobus roseus]
MRSKPIARINSVLSYASVLLGFLPVGLCVSLPSARVWAQTQQSQDKAVLSGRVVDSTGKPAPGARVYAEPRDGVKVVQTEAGTSGEFLIRSLEPGSYTIHATSHGLESKQSTLAIVKDSRQNITIVLNSAGGADTTGAGSAASSDSISLFDKPSFAVAGVTDWTAVGGHGSDATLRTSEELNREALALQAQTPSSGMGTAKAEEENKLLAVVSASPSSYEANRDLGSFYVKQAQFQKAVPILEKAARLNGDQPVDEYNLALACNGVGDLAAAQLHIKRALAQSDAAEFHQLSGEIEEKLGNPLVAVQQFQRATQLDPKEANYFAWGTELLLHRAIWQAGDVFASGAKKYPTSLRMKTAWGAALFAGALYDEAAEKICEASDMAPDDREPYLFAGQIVATSSSVNKCVGPMLERFVHQHPDDAKANYFYAIFLSKQARTPAPDRVRQLLMRTVAVDPKFSDAYLQLGILQAGQKDYGGAIAYYRKALEADSQNSEAHYRLGVAYDRTGEPSKAKAEYEMHEQIDAANAARMETERRAVKQFSIVPNASSAPAKPQ